MAMRWLRKISLRFRSLFRGKAVDRDLNDELRFHIERQTAENIAAGMTPADAQRAARIEFGATESFKEDCREARRVNHIQELLHDLRFGLRMLRKNPGFTAVAVLTLAIGIGACTAIFSAVNPILFEPLPYPHANRILKIWDIYQGKRSDVTFHTYREVAQRNRSLEYLSVLEPWRPTMTGPAEPERLEGLSVSATYFRVLGVAPALGRDFNPTEDVLNSPKVTIINDGLWKRRFGGDQSIVGRQIILDGDNYTVIGVMPREFEDVLAPSVEIWSPTQYDALNIANRNTAEWGHHLKMVARLKPAFNTEQARQDLASITKNPVPDFPRVPWASLRYGFIVDALQDDVTRSVKPALLAILGAVMLVLIIASVNVTNLLLARAAQRRGEFAVRTALGAERSRLIRQLLTESLLLATLGGVLGVVVALFGVRALVALSPPGLPRVNAIGMNGWVFAFALGVVSIVGLLFGLVPALQASRNNLHSGLQENSRRTAGGQQITRRALVIVEVALALVLMVSAGLLLRSLQRLFAVAPGFDASNVLTMQVQTSGHKFDDINVARRFFSDALDAVRRVPGVDVAAFSRQLPLGGDPESYGAQFEKDKPDVGYDIFRYGITPDYFKVMHIPLRRGRLLTEQDGPVAPVAVLISESLAKRAFPGRDPIGQRLHVGRTTIPWYTIVGIVGDVRQTSLALSDSDEVYLNESQWYFADDAMWLVVRARGDAMALVPSIQNAIWSVDKDQPIVRISSMEDMLSKSEAERHFALILFEAFGIVALTLAAIGIYGVLSGSVTERLREIGVRMALGATPGRILALIIRQGMSLTVIGAAIGVVGAVIASQAIVTLLFGVTPLDPLTYFGVIAVMAIVSAIACWVPAWRAARVDPAITLRSE
jgi:putative ABC transport system permease protein